MIELIHKHPILIKALLTLVTVTFVLTGGWILGKDETGDYAAKVEGARITMQDYQESVDRMEEFYRKVYQGNIPEEVLKKMDLGKKALEALIDKEVIIQEAKKQGLMVSDDEVAQAVKDNSSFAGPDGAFSREAYVEVLRLNGLNPTVYERQLRGDLLIEKFRKMVKDSVHVSEAEVRNAWKAQLEAQKKPFSEEEFQKQKDSLWRVQTMLAQEKTLASFMEGLKKNYEIEINPQFAPEAAKAS